MIPKLTLVIPLAAVFAAGLARAEVVRTEILSRADVLGGRPFGLAGPYEKLVGKIHFEVDPGNPRNRVVVDLGKAPRNPRGRVPFSADLYILRPKQPARANGVVLLEIPNRGRKLAFSMLSRARSSNDPTSADDFGDGFLLLRGFTVVWIGWQFDAPADKNLMRLYAPVATDAGKPITGLVRADYVVGQKYSFLSLGERGHTPYSAADPADPRNTLTVRDAPLGARRVLPRENWGFGRLEGASFVPDLTCVYLRGGFEPGVVYELVYRAQNPVVVGLGLAAVRDLISWLKHRPDAIVSARSALAIGLSQSGRFLRHFLYQGFNADEEGRKVLDGVLDHVAGAGRGSFNHRFAQPSRDGQPFQSFFYPTDLFPFADLEQTDPESGTKDGLLTRAAADGVLPRIFYTNSSHEYWGRCASLIHTTPDGRADAALPDNARIYSFAGGQHGPGPFPPASSTDPDYRTQHQLNSNDYTWSMRALLLAMDRWVREDVAPPRSAYPRISDGTLVTLREVAFPGIPGAPLPGRPKQAYRVDYGARFHEGIIDQEPPRTSRAFPILLPQVDADGNERAGVRMPEVALPLATYTGWNPRAPAIGAPAELSRLVGSYLPFARDRAARERTGDPRRSIEERYRSRGEYLGLFAEAAVALVREGFLLAEDVPVLLDRAGQHWEYATSAVK